MRPASPFERGWRWIEPTCDVAADVEQRCNTSAYGCRPATKHNWEAFDHAAAHLAAASGCSDTTARSAAGPVSASELASCRRWAADGPPLAHASTASSSAARPLGWAADSTLRRTAEGPQEPRPPHAGATRPRRAFAASSATALANAQCEDWHRTGLCALAMLCICCTHADTLHQARAHLCLACPRDGMQAVCRRPLAQHVGRCRPSHTLPQQLGQLSCGWAASEEQGCCSRSTR